VSLRDDLLPIFADVRGNVLDAAFGFRQYMLYVRTETPSDNYGGLGATFTVVDTPFPEKPNVRLAAQNDVLRSGGVVHVGDYILSGITPQDPAHTVGQPASAFKPHPASPGQRVYFVLVGPDLPAYIPGPPPSGGGLFERIFFDGSGQFSYRLILRPSTGRR
jgi:hypothetical protein